MLQLCVGYKTARLMKHQPLINRRGQKQRQGLPYSIRQRSKQIEASARCMCTGWSSSYSMPAKYTSVSRSRGGSVRSTQPGSRFEVASEPGWFPTLRWRGCATGHRGIRAGYYAPSSVQRRSRGMQVRVKFSTEMRGSKAWFVGDAAPTRGGHGQLHLASQCDANRAVSHCLSVLYRRRNSGIGPRETGFYSWR